MLTFRCTAKLRKRLRLRDVDLADVESGPGRDWFVDLVRIERRQCLLFTHAETLYSFWVPGVRKEGLERFAEVFVEHLHARMRRDGYSDQEIARFMGERRFSFTKTNSRSVLGSMREFVEMSRIYVEREGGFFETSFSAIADWLNRTPMSGAGPGKTLEFPVDVLEKRLRPNSPRSYRELRGLRP